MAKGPHAQAPKGALCFPTELPGEVYWDDEAMANAEELPPPPPDVVAEEAHKPKPKPPAAHAPAAHAPAAHAETKHG